MKVCLLATVAALALGFAEPVVAEQACEGPQDACQEITRISSQYNALFNNHDVSGVVELFTTDAVDVGEGVMASGREALEKFYTDAFKAGWKNHSGQADQVHVMGDWGWSVGSWSATPPAAKDASQEAHGTWGDVVVHQGGKWRIRMLTWNVTEATPEKAQTSASGNR